MVNGRMQIVNILSVILAVASLVFAGYGQFKDPQTGMIFFLGILIFVVLYFIVSFPIIKFVQGTNQIKKNSLLIIEIKKDLNNLNDKIDNIKDVAKLNVRLSSLEKNLK